jgi:NADPH-dependent F420 reductase
VAVLGGTGQQGRGLAQRLARAGASIVIGSRDPERAAASVARWPSPVRSARTATYGDAIAAADLVVLTVPYDAASGIVADGRTHFRPGALLIDVTVPMIFAGGTAMLADVPAGSATEHLRTQLPEHVRVAAAFKTLPAALLSDVERPLDCDEFVCGDSSEARERAVALVEMLRGVRAIDVGPLSRARAIEHATLLAIAVNRRHKIHDARFRVVGLT